MSTKVVPAYFAPHGIVVFVDRLVSSPQERARSDGEQ
jgi:hypothetical protein